MSDCLAKDGIEGIAVIKTHTSTHKVMLSPLHIAQIAANSVGFNNLDLKDNDTGNYTIVAYGPGKTLTCRGSTIKEAVSKLLKGLGYGE